MWWGKEKGVCDVVHEAPKRRLGPRKIYSTQSPDDIPSTCIVTHSSKSPLLTFPSSSPKHLTPRLPSTISIPPAMIPQIKKGAARRQDSPASPPGGPSVPLAEISLPWPSLTWGSERQNLDGVSGRKVIGDRVRPLRMRNSVSEPKVVGHERKAKVE